MRIDNGSIAVKGGAARVLRSTALGELIEQHEAAARRLRDEKPKPKRRRVIVRLVRKDDPRPVGFYEMRTHDGRDNKRPTPCADAAARTLAGIPQAKGWAGDE